MNQRMNTLVQVDQLYKEFPVNSGFLEQLSLTGGHLHLRRESVKAINGVDLEIIKGEALCLVGESGCGKSTVARVIMGLNKPTSGTVYYEGQRIDHLSSGKMMPFRRRMQMIFQNPYASLNPRMTIRKILEEPIRFHNPGITRSEVLERVGEVMESVGVDPSWGERFPHEFSGGQRQRISIARALTVDPEFIVADEPISALDVSIQAQVLNLMMEAREKHSLTYLFITHDLSVVEHFGTRVAVMYLGALCEVAPTKKLFSFPRHPYTRALLSAIPRLDEARPNYIKLRGEVVTPINLPQGCVFQTRCSFVNARCKEEPPKLQDTGDGVCVACHAVEEQRLQA
ncbi:MAG: ABC transporter ATP-binding protein [Deltaproteobacteria bacterium]|nr:ABC transporter ATP-binding protein [Deltaproteobacteria bacterium]|tara:strand:- start:32537 stop:33562 length:1026 start_codon:yes stop_codon:yes gene_type:complete